MSNIVDKIRKLLSITIENGATEGEVQNAMAMAQQLMVKHAISQGDIVINVHDIIESEINDLRVSYERTRWVWDLLHVIGISYNCTTLRKKKYDRDKEKLVYCYETVGFHEDVKVVQSLVRQLVPFIRRLGLAKSKHIENPYDRNKFYNSYLTGFISGLEVKLRTYNKNISELTDSERTHYQLICVKKTDLVNEVIEKRNPKLAKLASQTIDHRAYYDGYHDGKEYDELNKRLN